MSKFRPTAFAAFLLIIPLTFGVLSAPWLLARGACLLALVALVFLTGAAVAFAVEDSRKGGDSAGK